MAKKTTKSSLTSKTLKKHFRKVPFTAIFILVVGMFIGAYLFCASVPVKEKFTSLSEGAISAPLNYSMQGGVPNGVPSWKKNSWTEAQWYDSLQDNKGGKIPLPKDELDIFYDNTSDPSCCPSTYSSSMGCVCVSEKQAKYLNERGGNRTLTSYY